MKKKVFAPMLIILLICVMATGCSENNPLVGKWDIDARTGTYFFGDSEHIEFKSDKTVMDSEYTDDKGIWSTSGDNQLTVETDDEIYEFTYQISGNTLSITDEDGDTVEFHKK